MPKKTKTGTEGSKAGAKAKAKAPFVGLRTGQGTANRYKQTRTRIRDMLSEVEKNIADELEVQSIALGEGFELEVGETLTMTHEEIDLLITVVEAGAKVWESMDRDKNATVTKLTADSNAAIGKLQGLKDGTCKALSPEEKKKAQEELQALLDEQAATAARAAALKVSLGL